MSFLSGFGSLVAQRGVQAIAAGVLSGAVTGGALVATGIVPVGGTVAPPATIALRACPDAGAKLTDVADGDTLLVTGRSADGLWLEVYVGQPGLDRGWLPATSLTLDSSGDGLPVAACEAPTPAPLPSPQSSVEPTIEVSIAPTVAPSASPTVTATVTLRPSTGPSRTPPATPKVTPSHTPIHTTTPTPTPTPTPTVAPTPNAGPVLTNLAANPGNYCTVSSSAITVNATDSAGVQVVQITYTPPGASPQGPYTMSLVSGNTYRFYISSVGWSGGAGFVSYHVTAYDNYNASTTKYNVDDPNDPSSLYVPSFC